MHMLIYIFRCCTVKSLVASGRKAKYVNFPDRSTECGGLINSFLTNKKDFNDETIHLLFTLNRWEAKNNMEQMLRDGITLVVDRYAYSGVAFSAAKGLDLEWCKAPEAGLLKPDMVLLLTMTAAAISKRGGFGDERSVWPSMFVLYIHFFFIFPPLNLKLFVMALIKCDATVVIKIG